MTKFYHFNFNVLDLDRSLAFYKQALNLTPVREKEGADGSFKLVYLGDEAGSDFTLELTWLRDRTTPYDLGECEFHLAFRADDSLLDDLGIPDGFEPLASVALGYASTPDPAEKALDVVIKTDYFE